MGRVSFLDILELNREQFEGVSAEMRLLSTVCAIALGLGSVFSVCAVEAKEWTVDQRQQSLMMQINEGQKANELTVKEAKSLRKSLADLAKKKAKMKNKNGKSLSKDNELALEGDLNKISVEMQKLKLEKRVQTTK